MRIKRYFSLMPKDYAEIKLCRGNYYKGLRGSTRHNVYLHIRRCLMADVFLRDLKRTLDYCIAEFDSIHSLFCKNPETDFTRDRKITFSDTCRFLIELQSKSLPNEVMDYFGHTIVAPTVSAYIQQRQKILTQGWAFLFFHLPG